MAFKPAILLGLLCAALAANISPSLLKGYRSGHHYVYNFDGQIASSLSNGEDYSTIRLSSQVEIDILDSNNAIVDLQRPEIRQLHGFLDKPERMHNLQKFEQMEMKPEHVKQLDLPFQIKYENGKVSNIKFHRDDSSWSENIKRSIVNLLQVQLDAITQEVQEYPSSIVFKTNETTIEGQCESVYHLQQYDQSRVASFEESSTSSVNITKTINYDKCQRRPELRYNYYRSSEPVEWNSQQGQKNNVIDSVVNIMTQYEFNVENNRIQSARVLSKYSYDLVDKDHVSLATITVGQLVLKNTEKRSPPESDFPKKSTQDLMFSNELDIMKEQFITEGNEEYLRKNPYLNLENAADVIKNIMRRLVKSSIEKQGSEGVEEDAVRQFSHLVVMLRLASKKDIEEVHRQLFMADDYSEQTQQFIKEILADALATAGTKNTIDHLVQKINAEEITPSKAARTLEKLYMLRLTSDKMNQQIKKLCDSEVAQKNENLKRSCYLAWGAMVNAMCGHDHEHEHDHEKWAMSTKKDEKICPKSLKQQYVKDVMAFYERANTKADKILALKTLGNMGINESIKSLEKTITDKSEDRIIRIHSIDALRNLRDQVPQKLQRLLTPIFRDRREHPDVRMNTFQLLLQTRPDSALLHMLCADMAHESNVDVKSFVYSTIQGWAENAENTLDKETQQAIKSCIVLLEQIDQSVVRQSASKQHQTAYFSEPSNWHELGGLLNFVSLFSNDSYLPKEVMASIDALVDGRMIPNWVQLGVHMQELEQLAAKINKNVEEKTFDEVFVRGRRSVLGQYNPMEMMKNLFRKMELVARRRWDKAEPMFLIYRRQHNLDYSFILIDENSLPQILKKFIVDGKIDVASLENDNQIIRTNGAWFNFEKQLKLPTTMGIPMVIISRQITLGFVDGKYSIGFGKTEMVRDANIEVEVQPQLATSVIVQMQMFSPLFTSGVKTIHSMQGRLPINMQVEVKSPKFVPTISFNLPQQETRLIHLQSRPITFVRTWPQKSNVFIEAKEKTLLVPELERLHSAKDFESENPLTGMNFVVESHGYRQPWSQLDWMLSGENAFVLKIAPTSRTAKAVRITGEYSAARDAVSANQKLESIFEQRPEIFQGQDDQEIEALRQYIKRSSSKLVDFQRLVLRVESVQGTESNSVLMDLKAACNEHQNMCLFEKNVKADFANKWNWKTVGQVARPELNGIYGSVKSRHWVAKLESQWGAKEKNTVTLNLYGKPSQERVQAFKSLLNKNIDSQDAYERENMLDEKFEQLPTSLKVNDWVMSMEHQVSDKTLQTILPVYIWLKTCPKAIINIPNEFEVDTRMAQQHSTLMARITYDNAMNMTLTTPEEHLQMVHWEEEPKMSRKSKSIVDLFANSHDDYAKCTYKNEEVKTFDGQTIDIPMTSCYTLLAKDCGNSEKPNFALMAKRLNKRNNDLKLKFFTPKLEYQLYNDPKDGQMSILVNNEIIIESQYDKYHIHKIESNDMIFYEVRCPQTESILRFDGQKIIIKISQSYMNRQCGVCGHLNNDAEDDLLKNDNTRAKSIKDFHLSYLDRDGEECEPSEVRELQNMDENNQKSRRQQYNNYDSDELMTKKPIKKTLAIETRQDICFSIKPVKSCPRHFEATEQDQQREVDFKCYERTSPIAMRYLREVRQDSIVDFDSEEVTPDYNKMVDVPRLCVKY